MQLRAATKLDRCQLCSGHQKKKGSIKCETAKWEAVVTNDSIGTRSSGLFLHSLPFKLPAPPLAVLLVYIYIYIYVYIIFVIYIYIYFFLLFISMP